MENITIPDFERLEKLVCNKSFAQLTSQEKEWFLSFYTEKEYNGLRNFYKNRKVKSSYAEIEPKLSTKTKLDVALKRTKRDSKPIYAMKVSFYQSAAVALLCLLAGYWLNFSITKMKNSDKIAETVMRDTIEVIRYINAPITYIPFSLAKNQLVSKFSSTDINPEKNLIIDTLYHVANNVFVTDKNEKEIVEKLIKKSLSNGNEKHVVADTILKNMLVVFK